jgi:prepilin peptidase CpaA
MVATVLLVGLLLVATFTDVAWHRISNWITYPGMLVALGLNLLGTGLLAAGVVDRRTLLSLGWVGFSESLFGLLACGFVLLVCYVLFKVGGGDVKLMAMLGAFLGPQRGTEALLWTFVLGGCLGLIVLIWRVGPLRLAGRVLRQLLWTLRLGRWSPLAPEERAQLQLPLFLAPNALVAALIVEFALIDCLG